MALYIVYNILFFQCITPFDSELANQCFAMGSLRR